MSKQFFGTDGIRGKVGSFPISPDFMLKLGWAFGKTLRNKKVIIGKDTRLSGYMFESALEAGLVSAGADVVQLGPMPTPGISFLTKALNAGGGIVISASHNPYHDNGIKFFDHEGCKLNDDVEMSIEAMCDNALQTVASEHIGRASRLDNPHQLYQDYCHQSFPTLDLTGVNIALDCAHGAMYQIAPRVLSSFGAHLDLTGCTPNGLNINEAVGSTHPQTVRQLLSDTQASVGIAFDGDGDRVIMVDERGEITDGDEIMYIIAKSRQEQGTLNGGVVGTSMTNLGIEQAIKQLGIPFERAQVGDRYVLERLRQNQWSLGGETSGHIIDLSKSQTGDGLIAALLVLNEMQRTGKSLAELKSGVHKFTQTLINVRVNSGKEIVNSPAVQDHLKQLEARLKDLGRIVLRPSGTEPLVRVMVESKEQGLTDEVAQTLAQTVERTSGQL